MVINTGSFLCQNLRLDERVLVTGIFDADNPCSMCANRRHIGTVGKTFHYVSMGRWEFPFVAERNCKNFTLIAKPGSVAPDLKQLRATIADFESKNRIREVGDKFSELWAALHSKQVGEPLRSVLESNRVVYPGQMAATQFHREANELSSDLFEVRDQLGSFLKEARARWGVQDSKLDNWIGITSRKLRDLRNQIDDLETRPQSNGPTPISRWAFQTVAGGIAWDGFKRIVQVLRRLAGGVWGE